MTQEQQTWAGSLTDGGFGRAAPTGAGAPAAQAHARRPAPPPGPQPVTGRTPARVRDSVALRVFTRVLGLVWLNTRTEHEIHPLNKSSVQGSTGAVNTVSPGRSLDCFHLTRLPFTSHDGHFLPAEQRVPTARPGRRAPLLRPLRLGA